LAVLRLTALLGGGVDGGGGERPGVTVERDPARDGRAGRGGGEAAEQHRRADGLAGYVEGRALRRLAVPGGGVFRQDSPSGREQ
ncbi:hypothetical protein, partial [Mycobacterium tuberculosis]